MSLGGIVLAGGEGRRMGRPKAGVELDGVTLVDRAVAILGDAGCDPVIVADQGDEGPLAALAGPLAQLITDDVIVLACDLPLAAPVLPRLTAPAIAVDPDGRDQPLCSRWPRRAAAEAVGIAVAAGERRMSALIDALEPQRVAARADELLNVNTPDDLARATALLASRQ